MLLAYVAVGSLCYTVMVGVLMSLDSKERPITMRQDLSRRDGCISANSGRASNLRRAFL